MATKPQELASTEERGITSPSSPVHARPGLPGIPGSALASVPGPPAVAGATASPAPSREREAYSHLIDDYTHFSTLHQGETRQGRVVKISGDGVIVDIGYKNEGLVPVEQFRDAFGQIKVQPGDLIDVMLDNAAEVEGYIRLSHDRAKRLKLWEIGKSVV